MNAIDLLCAEHARLRWLLDEHHLLPSGAHDARVFTMNGFRADLTIHLALTGQLFCPMLRELYPGLTAHLNGRADPWEQVGRVCTELDSIEPPEEAFDTKAATLSRLVREQMSLEERTVFPRLRSAMDEGDLEDLGNQLQQLRAILAADPRPAGLGRPVGVYSAAAAQVIVAAHEVR